MPSWIEGGGSLLKRLDAVSSDYLTAYSIGPVALSDVSEGILSYVWRVRIDGTNVMLARQNVAGDGWDLETLLFTFTGVAVEIDLTFGQNAEPFVAFEKSDGTVWLYWYDPVPAARVQTQFAVGRTPRIILDDPFNTTESDVVLFYISPADNAIAYRTQRDRFATQGLSPVTPATNIYLERVIRTTGRRVAVVYSVHDEVAGQYSIQAWETTLYPVYGTEPVSYGVAALGMGQATIVITHSTMESAQYGVSVLGLNSVEPIIEKTVAPDEGRYAIVILGMNQQLVVIEHTTQIDEGRYTLAIVGMNQQDVVIEALNQPIESTQYGVSILGVNSVTV